jgi:hypothetical protein
MHIRRNPDNEIYKEDFEKWKAEVVSWEGGNKKRPQDLGRVSSGLRRVRIDHKCTTETIVIMSSSIGRTEPSLP